MIRSNSTHPNAKFSSILRLCAVLLLGLLTAPVISGSGSRRHDQDPHARRLHGCAG